MHFRNFVLLFALLTMISFTAGAVTVVYIGAPNGSSAPYVLDIYLGSTATGPFTQITAPCLSADLSVNQSPAGWQATETSIVDFSSTETALLEQATWLDTKFGVGGYNTTNVQDAIWDIGQKISGVTEEFTDSTTTSYLTSAVTNYLSTPQSTYAGYSLLIPVGGSGTSPDTWPSTNGKLNSGESQFFLVPGNSTPEPDTICMMFFGAALITFGKVGLKHRNKK